MYASFGLEREQCQELLFREITDDRGPFHFHSHIELYFVDEGEMDVFVNSRKTVLRQGEMSVALSYDAHVYRAIDSSKSSLIIIPPHMCAEFMQAVRNKRIKNPFIRDPETVQEIKFCVNAIRSCPDNPLKRQGYIYVMLGLVLENICLEEAETSIDDQLSSRLLFYIGQNYRKEISLSSLAAAFGYTPNYISRYFKSCFGVGINQYINIMRLRNALMLMQQKQYSHIYCALESGFPSMRTFYRVFQTEFHCSPTEYLQQKALHDAPEL